MAIYHLHAKIIGRSGGKSSVAAAAYRCAERMRDERTGVLHDYTRKSGVDEVMVLAPANAPAFVYDPSQLWNSVEQVETRKDAQLARDFDIALPRELSPEQRKALAVGWVKSQLVDAGMVAMIAWHDVDSDNPHVHVMASTREIGPDGWGKKNRTWNDKQLLEQWRQQWAEQANQVMQQHGLDQRIDHRTLAEQGIVREATRHMGPTACAMQKAGQQVDRTAQPDTISNPVIAELNRIIEREKRANELIKENLKLHETAKSEHTAAKAVEDFIAAQKNQALQNKKLEDGKIELNGALLEKLNNRLIHHEETVGDWKTKHPWLSKIYNPTDVKHSAARVNDYKTEIERIVELQQQARNNRRGHAADAKDFAGQLVQAQEQTAHWRDEEQRTGEIVKVQMDAIADWRLQQDNPEAWQRKEAARMAEVERRNEQHRQRMQEQAREAAQAAQQRQNQQTRVQAREGPVLGM